QIIFQPLFDEEDKSILIAELLEMGFTSFIEEDTTLTAYITNDAYKIDCIKDIPFLKGHPEIKFYIKRLEEKNWNQEWERNYEPVTIGGKCYVRAPFHPSLPGMTYEIVIEPKMSFGTAHHATTQLMAAWLMDLDVYGMDVLDMGCGTGILAILANKLGARSVMAVDNDEWARQNAVENLRNNNVTDGIVRLGDAAVIEAEKYDLILANINRNVLLQDMEKYAMGLRPGGQLLLSGFYEPDADVIRSSAKANGMKYEGVRTLNDWAALRFTKSKA
ncbi:MAG: 50S ribosomal protein L11 methyltransferase, partial [Bacteroidales bacterium]